MDISESWWRPGGKKSQFYLLNISYTIFLICKLSVTETQPPPDPGWSEEAGTVIYRSSLTSIIHWGSLSEKYLDEWQEASWTLHLHQIFHTFLFGHFVIFLWADILSILYRKDH